MANEPKCLKCGKSVFKVERMSPEQVTLTCDDCGGPHLIDAQLDEDSAR
jgi:DNA-directed RNA polymerase subunit RPC12/RpoP